jgi:protein TonB
MKMTSESLDELVFENRNKAYGAYVIRKEYARSLKTGMFITFASVCFLVLCSFVMKTDKGVIDNDNVPPIDSGIIVILPPPLPPLPPVDEHRGGPKSNVFIPMVVDKHFTDTTQMIVPQDVPPAPNDPGPETALVGPPASGGTDGGMVMPPAPIDLPVLIPDEVPEMEGGITKFLRRNLTYPETAVMKKTTGTVYIYFVVERDGSVGNVSVLKGIGDGCEEEATRVVKKMKWKPGKNHGNPVRVQFTLPVKFTINE